MAYSYKRGKYYWVGWYEGGKQRQKSLRVTTKDEARVLLAEYILREAKHRHRSKALKVKVPIGDLFDAFIENLSRSKTKEWYRHAKEHVIGFCAPRGLVDIHDITAEHLQEFYNSLYESKPGSARAAIRALKTVFNYAMERGDADENPAKLVKVNKETKKLFRNLSDDEIKAILETARVKESPLYPIIAVSYYAGLRKGEAVFLEARDVDYDGGYITVRSKPENLIKDHQERKVPLSRKLRAILRATKPGEKWFFETPAGKPRWNNLNRDLERLVKVIIIEKDGEKRAFDMEGFKFQVFRETFGSHLRRRGVDLALISSYMGHSSLKVTMDHYVKIETEQTHDEIDKL